MEEPGERRVLSIKRETLTVSTVPRLAAVTVLRKSGPGIWVLEK